jgi:hypothetical protein
MLPRALSYTEVMRRVFTPVDYPFFPYTTSNNIPITIDPGL